MKPIEVKSVIEMFTILRRLQFEFGNSTRGDSFIFRGHENADYKLLPGIYREFPAQQEARLIDGSIDGLIYTVYEGEILAHFKKEAAGTLGFVAQDDEFTWMQYAQHYGVLTRLLDFTANPLIALYFCCKSENQSDGAVWVLNSRNYQTWMNKDFFCEMNWPDVNTVIIRETIFESMKGYAYDDPERVEMHRPLQFVPAYIDQRMSAQSSRFLLWAKEQKPLEEMITVSEEMNLSHNGEAFGKVDDTRFLSKIVIPEICKHDIINELNLMDINEKTVFPGLDGLGRYIEKYYRNNADDICRNL